MKLINEEGKLFGKINIIDLFILVFVVAIVAFGITKVTADKGPGFVTANTDYEADILLRAVYDGFQDEINVGDKVYDAKSGAYIGTITSKEVGPAMTEVESASGEVVRSEIPTRWDVTFTIEGSGPYNEQNGISIGGEARQVGLYFQMKTNNFIISGVIVDIRLD